LNLAYTTVPAALWTAPVPLVGLAADANLLWHGYRRVLPRCDVVLTDAPGAAALHRAGLEHVVPANLYGPGRSLLEAPATEGPRDIDVLFVGNLHPAVQRERLAWLGRLARLGRRWRVVIRTGVFGADYRALLARARVVFNRSVRGECNMRTFEATAAGALLFQEAGNQEMPAFFSEGEEYVAYQDNNLEDLLEHYLSHEEERERIARAGQQRARGYGYEALWQKTLALLASDWSEIQKRCQRRVEANAPRVHGASPEEELDDLLRRLGQALSAGVLVDRSLPAELEAAQATQPFTAALPHALGLAQALAARGAGPTTADHARAVAGAFYRAVNRDPTHIVAFLNLAEALIGSGQREHAAGAARHALALLERGLTPGMDTKSSPTWLDAGHFPPGFDAFRVEWERAGWDNAGAPETEAAAKAVLLRWRLHALLADLSPVSLSTSRRRRGCAPICRSPRRPWVVPGAAPAVWTWRCRP
jgi:hypothetical protein